MLLVMSGSSVPRHARPHVAAPPRLVLAIVVVLGLATGFAAVAVATWGERGGVVAAPEPSPVAVVATERPRESEPLRILRSWDRARSRAYARADAAALAALYLPESHTGSADLSVLRGYRDRGLRVTSLRTRVIALRVLDSGPVRLKVEVTDVLIDATAVAPDGRRWTLPADRPTTRTVVLRLVAGRWLVEEAYDVGPGDPSAAAP